MKRFALALLPGLALAACHDHAARSNADGMVIRLIADPGSLDPQSGSNGASTMTSYFSYDRIVANVDGHIEPQIAERWQAAPDQVTLWIRRDVTCSDGHHLTAGDVAANFRRMVDPEHGVANAPGIFGSNRITVNANDRDSTVHLTMAVPNSDIMFGLARTAVICPAGLADLERVRSHPVGTGPYELIAAQPGESYTYRRRPEYHWGPASISGGQHEAPETVILRVVENDSTAANLLSEGKLDIARVVGPDRLRLDRDGRYTRRIVSPSLFGLYFNQHPGRPGQDIRVRRALVEAIDRHEVAFAAVGAHPHAADSFQMASAPCYDPDDIRFIPKTDLAAAARDLDAAGYRLSGGIRRDANGRPLTIRAILNSDHDLAADLLASRWQSLGIKVEISAQNEAQITQTTFDGGDWDVVMVNGDATISGRNAVFFTGKAPGAGINITYSTDATYATLVNTARRTPMPSACAVWRQANQRLLSTVAVVPIVFGDFAWYGRRGDFKPVFNDQSALFPTSLHATHP